MKNSACFREFAKYSSLNILGMMALSCYILADTFFVAKGLGTNGLTALNLAIPIYSFIHGCGLMFGMGGATKYAICKSQKNSKEANRTFTMSLLLTFFFALVFVMLGIFFSEAIAYTLGADDAVFQMAQTYIQIILLFAPMFILNNVLLCFVRNDGAPQLSMMAMIGGSLSNIVLDYIFIFPLNMGIMGAVLATGLAPMISMFLLLPYFIKRKSSFHFIKVPFSKKLSIHILSSGLPSFVTEVSSGIVIIVLNTIILQLQGNVGVAAYGVIANLSLVVIAIYTGIAQGIQPLLSKYHGFANKLYVNAILRYALCTSCILSIMVYAGIFFGADQIALIFNSERNPILQDIAITGLKIYFTACLFAGLNIILSVYFTSIENTRPAHIISLLRGFIIIIPMAFILSSIGGILGVWWVFPVTEILVACITIILYLQVHTMNTHIIKRK